MIKSNYIYEENIQIHDDYFWISFHSATMAYAFYVDLFK